MNLYYKTVCIGVNNKLLVLVLVQVQCLLYNLSICVVEATIQRLLDCLNDRLNPFLLGMNARNVVQLETVWTSTKSQMIETCRTNYTLLGFESLQH